MAASKPKGSASVSTRGLWVACTQLNTALDWELEIDWERDFRIVISIHKSSSILVGNCKSKQPLAKQIHRSVNGNNQQWPPQNDTDPIMYICVLHEEACLVGFQQHCWPGRRHRPRWLTDFMATTWTYRRDIWPRRTNQPTTLAGGALKSGIPQFQRPLQMTGTLGPHEYCKWSTRSAVWITPLHFKCAKSAQMKGFV